MSRLLFSKDHWTARPTHVALHTLGRFALDVGAEPLTAPPTLKARALLTYLAMSAGAEVARELLMDTFWPDAEPQRARDSLNTALHAVRRCFRLGGFIPDAYVVATRTVVRWIAECDVDAMRLRAIAPNPSLLEVRAALADYGGEFLPGCYDDWSVAERERLEGAYERVLIAAVRDYGDLGAARRLLALNPYEESAYILLLDSEPAPLRFAALARRCRLLFAESGLTPSAALQLRLERRLPPASGTVGRAAWPRPFWCRRRSRASASGGRFRKFDVGSRSELAAHMTRRGRSDVVTTG